MKIQKKNEIKRLTLGNDFIEINKKLIKSKDNQTSRIRVDRLIKKIDNNVYFNEAAKPKIDNWLRNGISSYILAFGQTNAGKILLFKIEDFKSKATK